jgi:short-subunit dehydrogenase
MNIEGKTVVVTGAASGIGRAIVEQLAAVDCVVLAVDRNIDGLSDVLEGVRGKTARIQPYGCDLSDSAQVDSLFDHAIQEMGQIDLFIANAGFPYYEVLGKPDWGHIERIFQVNVFSPIYAALKMKEIYPEGGYKMVMTASGMAKIGIPGYALYSSSKAAIDRFADAYRFELDNPNSLMLVYPIATRTQFFKEASEKTAPVPWPSQSPELVAQAVLHGIAQDRQAVFPSNLFWVVWKLGAFFPWLYRLEQWIELRRLRSWLGVTKEEW